MKVFKLASLGLDFNNALDSGKWDNITVAELKEQIKNGTIFDYLRETCPDAADLSVLTPADKQELGNEWLHFTNVEDEFPKLCVNSKGLYLLVAYLFEGLHHRIGINIQQISCT